MRLATPLLVLLLLAIPARAQTPGQCRFGQAQARLNVSDVGASLFNTGSLFFGNATTNNDGYTVPRFSGRSPIFSASLWVGGRVGGEVRVAGARYTNFNFWPGPLDATGSPVNPADCSAYDRIWTVSVNDVGVYEQTGTATADLATWPVGLGAATVTAGGQPVVPTSITQTIDLAAGERPVVYGSQTAFWVMNDVGNVKRGTLSAPIGLEVRVHAFAVASLDPDLARATFYRVGLINRGTAALQEARASLFVDPDLGNAVDDYIGSDSTRGMAFVYNADNDDGGPTGYGVAPPAVGFDLLSGAGASSYFKSDTFIPTADPTLGSQIYNYQQGLWADGTEVRTAGDGYGETTGSVTPFMFPGDPVTNQAWSERNNGTSTPANAPGDRRMAVSSVPFTLQPGESRTVDLAILYGRGSSNLASITALRQVSDRVQALNDDGSLYRPGLGGPPPSLPGTPALVSPADGADVGIVASVRLDWSPVPGAAGYGVEVALDPAFSQGGQQFDVVADSLTFVPPPNVRQTYYWRVRAVDQGGAGPASDVRRFTAYGPYRAELEGLEEWDASGPIVTDADGTATDPSLLGSVNSTRTSPPSYLIGAQGAPSPLNVGTLADPFATSTTVLGRLDFNDYLTAAAPNDYEIRWVDPAQGQAVLNRTAPARYLTCWEIGRAASNTASTAGPFDLQIVQAPIVNGTPRMPFQYWEVHPDGSETQVHMNVLDTDADNCYSFDTNANVGGGTVAGFGYERFYGSRVPYIESELANVQDVFTRSNVPSASAQAFGRMTILMRTGPARPPQAGTRIRIATTDDYTTAAEAPPAGTAAIALEPARPNPVRGRAGVRFTTGTAGTVRLTVYDVLGRRVAVLAQGELPAGPHEATLDASRLAPGVYLLVLESGASRAVRPVTVVR